MSTQDIHGEMSRYWALLKKEQKETLASELCTTVGYLRQVFKYGKQVGPKLAVSIDQHTPFSKERLRPDIFSALPDNKIVDSGQN